MTKEEAIDALKQLQPLDERFANIASVAAIDEAVMVAALIGWIGLDLVRRSVYRLATISGVDVDKELIPDAPKSTPVVVPMSVMVKACKIAAGLTVRQLNQPTIATAPTSLTPN